MTVATANDILDLTPAEMASAQRKAKMTTGLFGAMSDPNSLEFATAVAAYVWVVRRRDDPAAKYEDTARLSLRDLMAEAGIDLDEDGDLVTADSDTEDVEGR